MRIRQTLAFCFVCQAAAAHSLPEDTYAFPKYRVSFLNGLPLLRETAERWLQEGLRGGESEFLDQPWQEANRYAPPPLKGIGDGEAGEVGIICGILVSVTVSNDYAQPDYLKPSNVTLERMQMGPDDSYICLIPPAPESPASQAEEQEDATPAQSWALLKPLSGKCLYVRLHPIIISSH
jgi:protein OS-9